MTEADYILIDKKLDEDLTPDEAQAFDQRCAHDPEFAEEYALQQQLIDTFRAHHPQRLKAEMKALHQEVKSERQIQHRKRIYAIAATITLLLVATIAFFYFRPPSPEALYAEYYHPYQAKFVVRGAPSAQKGSQAEDLYDAGQLATAIPLLGELSETEQGALADRWRLILGNAYLQSDSIPQAIRQFERVTKSSNGEYQEFAKWYTAMSLLKAGDTQAAENILQPIANQPGPFQDKARQLLDEL